MKAESNNFCPFCGVSLPTHNAPRFCPSCGEGLENTKTQMTPTLERPPQESFQGPGLTIPMESLTIETSDDTVATQAIARPKSKPAPLVAAVRSLKKTQIIEPDTLEPDTLAMDALNSNGQKGTAPLQTHNEPEPSGDEDSINISPLYADHLEAGDHVVGMAPDRDALNMAALPTQALQSIEGESSVDPESVRRTELMSADFLLKAKGEHAKTARVQVAVPSADELAEADPVANNSRLWLMMLGLIFLLFVAGGALVLLFLDTQMPTP